VIAEQANPKQMPCRVTPTPVSTYQLIASPPLASCEKEVAMTDDRPTPRARFHVAWWYGLFGAAALVSYFVLRDHGGHIAAVLPYLLLAACPLMHLFHHHGRKRDAASESRTRSGEPHTH
jgi:hypothetical protein